MSQPVTALPPRALLTRAALYLVLWWIIADVGDPVTAAIGVVAALGAARLSLWLLPANPGRLRKRRLAALGLGFLRQSIVAGFDVARRAFSPGLPIAPGYIEHSFATPPGDARNLFTAITCLMPGSLPTGADDRGVVLYHCLDVTQSVGDQLVEEERRLNAALDGALGSARVDDDRAGQR
jgi:multicomponent Na+:H+ antiporter subunit E